MSVESQTNVTVLLRAWEDGDPTALEKLTPLVYSELRKRAHRYMARERSGHVLDSCALVHEAFLRLFKWKRIHWENREQFFGVSAALMRKVLVDFARAHGSLKREGSAETVRIDEAVLAASHVARDFRALDEALDRLARIEPRKARVVELRFFGGLSIEEIASALTVNPFTVLRDWKFARSWLRREMERINSDGC